MATPERGKGKEDAVPRTVRRLVQALLHRLTRRGDRPDGQLRELPGLR